MWSSKACLLGSWVVLAAQALGICAILHSADGTKLINRADWRYFNAGNDDGSQGFVFRHRFALEISFVWRAFFFAVGTMLIIVGVECLLIDSATLAAEGPEEIQVTGNQGWFQQPKVVKVPAARTVRPPEWVPWSLVASGAVVVLYAMTLPVRWGIKSST